MRRYENEQAHIHPLAALEELAHLRRHPVILLCGTGAFSSDGAAMLYALLRQLGHQEALDIVLQSPGGQPAPSRRLAVLLREFTKHLTVLVLQQAHSAGALFCLAADELIMSPLSTLTPIDPQAPGQLSGGNDSGQTRDASTPRSITTEEMRLFRTMASAWFGVGETVEERFSLLNTFTSRIFPTTLTALFRADQEMRQAADELLRYHQPDTVVRQRISDQLIGGFFSHMHAIHRQEARELGLNVVSTTEEEEACLWRLLGWWQAYQDLPRSDSQVPGQMFQIRSVLVSSGFAAHDVIPVAPASALPPVSTEGSPDPSALAAFPRRLEQRSKWGWRQFPLDALSLDQIP